MAGLCRGTEMFLSVAESFFCDCVISVHHRRFALNVKSSHLLLSRNSMINIAMTINIYGIQVLDRGLKPISQLIDMYTIGNTTFEISVSGPASSIRCRSDRSCIPQHNS
jgi:hypothetical protein